MASGELTLITTLSGVNQTTLTDANFADATSQTQLKYLTLDGVNDFGTGSSITLGSFTIEATIRDASPTGFGGIFAMQVDAANFIQITTQADGTIIAEVKDSGTQTNLTSTATVNDGNFHHVAFSYDATNGNVQLYIDGTAGFTVSFCAQNTVIGGSITAAPRVGIERDANDGPFFSGDIAEMRVWSTVRSAADINTNKTNLLTGSEAGLEHYWKFQEGSGLTVADSDATNNNTLTFNEIQSWATDGPVFTGTDPLVFDLDGDGVELVGSAANVTFDIDGDGVEENVGWFGPDDGVLVVDINQNGIIDDMSEIVSQTFRLATDQGFSPTNSLEALSFFDDDGNGLINDADSIFDALRIWVDADTDGDTDDGELRSLDDAGITSINLAASGSETDVEGNTVWRSGEYTNEDGETGEYAEVSFAIAETATPSDEQPPDVTTVV